MQIPYVLIDPDRGVEKKDGGEDREGEDADKERVAASCRLDGRSPVLRDSVGAGGDRAPRSYPTRGGRVQGDGVLPHQSPSTTARGQGFLPGRPLQAECVPTAREAQAIRQEHSPGRHRQDS